MDCYYHSAVPSVAVCNGCGRAVCAHCRDEAGTCPGCRLGARIDASTTREALHGRVGPTRPGPAPRVRTTIEEGAVPVESRALAALGYPLWPLALVGLLGGRHSRYLRRHAWQALGFNFGIYAFWLLLNAIASVPFFGWPAYPMLGVMIPLAFVANIFFGIRAWHGDEVRVPVVSDWVDRSLGA